MSRPRLVRSRAAALAAALLCTLALLAPASSAVGPHATVRSRSVAHHDSGHDHVPGRIAPTGHEEAESLQLRPQAEETVERGSSCPASALRRSYDIAAIRVDITVNRFGDHDPDGRMYVLEDDVGRVRAEEAANQAARADEAGEPAVSIGLMGDAIQPLVVRVNAGECLTLTLRNELTDEPASLHLHGSTLGVRGGKGPATASNRSAMAEPGSSVAYEWMVDHDEPEGTHYFHSHGDAREQTGHGLFGALIVEPPDAEHLDPRTGKTMRSGWDAVIRQRDASTFREFATLYHEIGDETYQLVDRRGDFIPLVDPLLGAYRPSSRALNYRSEPFLNRMELQRSIFGRFDESLAYSSYSFGDPATPVMRTYLGERTKQRVVHAGSEVFHVHHVHGGSIRWRRQPTSGGDDRRGLVKRPAILPGRSERTDAQTIGPAESFDVENECGAGGCQQGAGDFLFHCHVAHHYFAGMWGIWRVYNTAQDGSTSTDSLPPLAAIEGSGSDDVRPAVTSSGLIGRTISGAGRPISVDRSNLAAWVERQLPPRGIPRGYDASVLDWDRRDTEYLGEPESEHTWPGYRSRAPAERPPLLFDPETGKLAYPFLRPQLARRPPFAPGHGPAPYLDPPDSSSAPPPPGASGPASVCPEGTRLQSRGITAISVPVPINPRANLVDPDGEVFVLTRDAAAVRADPSLRRPLALRANAGEDCIDVTFRSELEDTPVNRGFAKVDVHIHFVQFDVQGSDGLTAGFNYEQSVRPYSIEGERLTNAAARGSAEVVVTDTDRFQPGSLVGIGLERDGEFESRVIVAIRGRTLVLDAPLTHDHANGESVSTEFVRYRWYPDAQFGTAYFHDHVNGLESWRHGLTGALIVEPPGSSYRDPTTGEEVASGPVADIHTQQPFGHDVKGSFREQVLFMQDDIPLTASGQSTGGSFNLRAEPLRTRPGDPALAFSSIEHGDPATPIVRAHVGDPVVFRNLVSGTNEVHSFHLDGHWFRTEPHSPTSPPVNTVNIGISERFDVAVPAAGGPQRRTGDYLFSSGRSFKLRDGSWGILRVLESGEGDLRQLPGRTSTPSASGSVCPVSAPRRRFAVSAAEVPLPMLDGEPGRIFVLDRDRLETAAGRRPPEPLTLRVTVGDCVEVRLSNRLPNAPISFHTDLLAADPISAGGVAVGTNPRRAVDPGKSETFFFYADPEVGEVTAMVRDMAAADKNTALGLYGAIVVAPAGSRFTDPTTGADLDGHSSWRADVHPPAESPYRDSVLYIQDEDPGIGTHRMPYAARVAGVVGLNYRVAPLGDEPSSRPPTPSTPMIEARAGDPVRLHVLTPWSEQTHVFAVEGHRWRVEPRADADLVDAAQLGGLNVLTIDLDRGAGGSVRAPGDYLYGDHREPYREAGLWGYLRVHPMCGGSRLQAIGDRCGADSSSGLLASAIGGGSAVVALSAAVWRWRRRRVSSEGLPR